MELNDRNTATSVDLPREATSTNEAQLMTLGRRLYDLALVRSSDETLTDPRGNPIGWLLDTRIPMLDSTCFQDVGKTLSGRLREKGIQQVLGYGFGSYSIVCSILSGCDQENIVGGFIRAKRKPHGRRRIVEGPVDRSKPVVLVDDILNSGQSALSAIERAQADGFQVDGLMALFNFTWSGGRTKVESRGVWVDCLLDLNLRNASGSTSGSSESDGHLSTQ